MIGLNPVPEFSFSGRYGCFWMMRNLGGVQIRFQTAPVRTFCFLIANHRPLAQTSRRANPKHIGEAQSPSRQSPQPRGWF